MNRRTSFVVGVLIVIASAALTALSGNGAKLPLDTHEIFVARSAEEMLARGSFLVPYLNDQPRLKKPPLSYWLVMAIDRLNGGDGRVTELEARLPSIIAGILLVAVTCGLGTIFFGRTAGLTAGLLLAGSGGYVTYTHSARPEMLYAMFCAAGVLGFALSDLRHRQGNSRSKWFAWLAWLMMGLAMLTKGPQLPMPMVAGWIIALVFTKRSAEIRPVLRPLSGLLIMVTVSLWWYAALWRVYPDAWAIWHAETIDRMSPANVPKSEYLDPFYLYRTAQLMLPWVVFFILAAAAPWLKEFKNSRDVRILWWMIVTPMIMLSFWLGRREYYMLPTTGVAAALLTMTALTIGRGFFSTGGAWIWRIILGLHVAVLAAGAMAMRSSEPQSTKPPIWATAAVTVAACAALFIICKPRASNAAPAEAADQPRAVPPDSLLVATLCVGIVFFASMAVNISLWQEDRIPRRDFSLDVGRTVRAAEPLIGWEDIWEVDQYYLHRVIPSYTAKRDILAALRDINGEPGRAAWVLVSTRDDPRRQRLDLPNEFQIDRVLSISDPLDAGEMQLWRVTSEH